MTTADILRTKLATPEHPVHDWIRIRWSPYAFADRDVSVNDLMSLFEAARWAPSSYNEQPWRYLVATREDPREFEKMVSCLNEGNQPWARRAPVLALGLVKHTFERNGERNRSAIHDLGIASAFLTLEATARGLHVHQMIGIQQDKIRELYQVPDDVEPYTGLAIGYSGHPHDLEDKYRERDLSERSRKPMSEILFTGQFGEGIRFQKAGRLE